ncbi:MAG: hypothetical protein NTY01_23190 [Verrucomicrobia bacterium]|nr:hypothetical protein [Verrucomicrobiota bacterium]
MNLKCLVVLSLTLACMDAARAADTPPADTLAASIRKQAEFGANTVRAVMHTTQTNAAMLDTFRGLVRTGSWTEVWPDHDGKPQPREVTGELWTVAIQAALDRHDAVTIPAREKSYYLDAPIVLKSGQSLVADPKAEIRLKPGVNTCMVCNANPFNGHNGPVPANLKPDENIAVVGGIWTTLRTQTGAGSIYNDNRQGRMDTRNSIVGAHGVMCFNNVRGLLIRIVTVRQSTPFAVQLSNASRFVIENVTFEDHGRDGIHLNGPLRDGVVRGIGGVTHDDFVALNAWDWRNSTMTFGAIERVLVERIRGSDHACASLRLLTGRKRFANGTTLDCPIRDCVFRDITGLNDIKAYDQPNLELGRANDFSEPIGTLSNLHFQHLTIPRPRAPATIQIHANADGIHIEDVTLAFDRKSTDKLVSIGPLSMTYTHGSADPAKWVEVFSPDQDCTVRNLTVRGVRDRTSNEHSTASLVRVIEQKVNADYPKTKPRGGTGKGVWVQ